MATKQKSTNKPVEEVRIGSVKAAIWKNETEAGRDSMSRSSGSTAMTPMAGGAPTASAATTCWCWRKSPIRPTAESLH